MGFEEVGLGYEETGFGMTIKSDRAQKKEVIKCCDGSHLIQKYMVCPAIQIPTCSAFCSKF